MKFIKISILSLLILFLLIIGIVAGTSVNSFNDSSNSNAINKYSEKFISSPSRDGITVEFDDEFISNGEQILTVRATWSLDEYLDYFPTTDAQLQITDVSTGEIHVGLTVQVSDDGAPKPEWLSLTYKVENGVQYWHYEAIINGYGSPTPNTITFQENSDYIVLVRLGQNFGQEVKFTTPSKSVINSTDTTGDIINVTNQSVEIDTSWIQVSNQVSDNIFSIDENLELTLKTGSSSADYDETNGDIDITAGVLTQVTGLTAKETYSWTIVGNYYNGYETVDFTTVYIEFTTKPGISYDYKTIDILPTDNSIIVTLDIINDDLSNVDMKFYDGPKEDGKDRKVLSFSMIDSEESSDTNPNAVKGWVTYEITDLDYKTDYDLYMKIGDNYEIPLGIYKTLDAYSWTTPLNITLLVLIIIGVIASASLFGWLFMHGR